MDILDLVSGMRPTPKPAFISKQVVRGQYVFVDLAPVADTELTLVCAGREECSPDYRMHRSGFRYHAVEYIVSGGWELDVNGRRHALGPGAIFTYGPRTRYTLRVVGSGQPVKFFVDFAGRDAAGLVRQSGLREDEPRHVGQTRWLHDILDQILDGANLSRAAARRLGTRLTELLLLRVREDLRPTTGPNPEAHRTYVRCRQFIQDHYPNLRSIEEIAHRCSLSPPYLSRLFRRFANESPFQFLTRLKMDHAAELILRQSYAVKQAAAAVGYDDPYHFSRVFKRVHGVAPGRFARGG